MDKNKIHLLVLFFFAILFLSNSRNVQLLKDVAVDLGRNASGGKFGRRRSGIGYLFYLEMKGLLNFLFDTNSDFLKNSEHHQIYRIKNQLEKSADAFWVIRWKFKLALCQPFV